MEPVEARILITGGFALSALAILFAFFPRLLALALAVLFVWIALALLYLGYKLHRQGKQKTEPLKKKGHSSATTEVYRDTE